MELKNKHSVSSGLRNFISGIAVVFSFVLLQACNNRRECQWRTVADLAAINFARCPKPDAPNDSMYVLMNRFSAGFDSVRRKKGIPLLPENYEAEVFTVSNQVRWHGALKSGKFIQISTPFMRWKDLGWKGDTLLYDRSIFIEGNVQWPAENYLTIVYYLDTLAKEGSYKFRCNFESKNDTTGVEITKSEADSILSAWRINN